MNFKEFKLNKKITDALDEINYLNPTPIQQLAIPKILEGKDVIGIAQTGTGKTASFALPIINKLSQHPADKTIKALILVPTRELAIQIRDNIRSYTKNTDLKCSVILGGSNQESQIKVLKNGLDILVATPGRLVDLINQKKVKLDLVETLVLDEADTMLDMGFIKDIKFIINKTPKQRQTLLFSATIPDSVKNLAVNIMQNPIHIKANKEEVTANKINQQLYFIDSHNKINLLLDLIDTKEKPTTLIFVRTKQGANELENLLEEYQIKASVIHGDKKQSNRVKALQDFKKGKTRILVATDIAARGLDISDLQLVINYEMPEKPELYVHRIGRTARAGKDGVSISLCSSAEKDLLRAIEKLIKMKIPVVESKYKMELIEKSESSKRSDKTKRRNNHIKNNPNDFRNYKKINKKPTKKGRK